MNHRAWLRLGAKTVHDVASIAYGGALAACLVINHTADLAATSDFLAARLIYAAIAKYVLVPSMAVVVLSGLLALAATRAYSEAGWAWLKALTGISVFAATLMIAGSAGNQGEVAQAAAAGDMQMLQTLLRSERNTLWLLIVLCVVNVVLAVWRPKLT
ncbi:hypothetical protein [Caenimonas koreensis]|uniref:DUF2269 family protein n=1 Tax=Caenimonas koreensis DSM 17982 TaxID=1121255 RepID=A0A844B902_9BURK|nr:hypothetical protein [Caenimonas koreensis]MRD47957.1 hypothetical protein [Caenimonas koreensis DSM 17982]